MITAANDEVTTPRIILAMEPDFELGGLQVRPARRLVCPAGGDCRDVEPRVMQVLVALAQAGGEIVSRDELIEACWDGRIVGDDSINRCMVALRRLAKTIDPEPFAIETVARVGYCLIERPPVRAAEEGGAGRTGALGPGRRRFALAAAAASALAAALALGIYLRSPAGAGAAEPPRLRLEAVRTLSPDLPPGIGERFAEELVTAFEVDDTATIITPGRRGAADRTVLALSGAVQKAGDRLRFATRLRNERSGASLWAQTFELPASSAGVAPGQVAARVSQVLRCGLPGAGRHLERMTDRQLSLWLQFCQETWSGAPTTRNRIVDAARRVTAAAPDFSRGWSSLALYVQPMGAIGPQGDAAAMRAEAAGAVARALRLDPQNSEAYAARAASFVERHDWIEVERLLSRAISIRPTDCACEHHQYGFVLTVVGRAGDAVDQYRRYRDRQPLTLLSNASLAEALSRAGRHEEAERILNEMLRLWPGEEALLDLRLRQALWTRRQQNALDDPRLAIPAGTRAALAATFASLREGGGEDRRRAAEMLKTLARDPRHNSRLVTTALAAIGEDRAAIESAERNGFWMRGVLFEPNFESARHDPAFAALARRLGLVRYWRQTRRLPDFCREANAPALCRDLES